MPSKGLRGFSRSPRGVCSQGGAEGGERCLRGADASRCRCALGAAAGGERGGERGGRCLPPPPPFISPSLRPRPLAPPGPWAAAAAFSSPSSSSCPQVSSGDARGRGTRRDTALLALVMRGALRGSVGSSPPGRGSRGRPACVQPGATRVRGYPRRRAPGASLALVKLWGQPGSGKAPGGAAIPARGQTRRAKERLAPSCVRHGGTEPCPAWGGAGALSHSGTKRSGAGLLVLGHLQPSVHPAPAGSAEAGDELFPVPEPSQHRS